MKDSSSAFNLIETDVFVDSVDAYALACVKPIENFNRSVEIPKALEGDKWKVTLSKKKRRLHLLEASLLDSSSSRIQARCPHFDVCGGCQWQHVNLDQQRKRKEAFVLETLGAHITDKTIWHGLDFAQDSWRYRNKIELTFRQTLKGDKFLGFHAGKFRVVDVEECHLCGLWTQSVIHIARSWWHSQTLAAYHPGSDRGSLRQLVIRESCNTEDKMIILVVSGHPDWAMTKAQIDSFKEAMLSSVDSKKDLSLYLVVHQAIKGQPTRFFEMHLNGPEVIREKLQIVLPQHVVKEEVSRKTLEFAISPATFFQPNTTSAQKLYGWALAFAGSENKKAVVWDLFCGSGTLSLALASEAQKVIGVEVNPMAVLDAEVNAGLNGVTNASFECFDLHKSPDLACKSLMEKAGRPDVVVVDPPRAGVMEKGITLLSQIGPEVIVYVSCNPLSQAKDIESLKAHGYLLLELVAVDQFPHTGHVETVALLKRRETV